MLRPGALVVRPVVWVAVALGACAPTGTGRTSLQPADLGSLEIRFLDVSQADATLITVGRYAVLVDASGGDDITLDLAHYRIDSLVALVASHNHDDHIGGMDAVVADIPIGRFFGNGRPPTTSASRLLQSRLVEKQVPRDGPPWPPIQLGDVRITVFPSALGTGASENNSSLGVLVERGAFRALLTGDSEREALAGWLSAGAVPRVTVLKAAHHGAENGVTPGWIDRTRPEIVVISVGAKNKYGHPDPQAMRYYQLHDRRTYRTDQNGTITITVDRDGHYRVTTSTPIER